MTATPSTYLVNRSYLAQFYLLDGNFYAKGQNATLANGATSSSYVASAWVKYKPAQPTYESAWSYASEQLRGRAEYGITDYGLGTFTSSEYDETLNQLAGGSTPSTTAATGLLMTSPNSGQKTPPRLGMILSAGAVNPSSAQAFQNICLMNVVLRRPRVGTDQAVNKNPNNLDYEIVMSTAARSPFGTLLSGLSMALTNNQDTELLINSPGCEVLTSYVDDGIATTIILPFTPLSVEHAGALNIFTKNGVDAHSSVSGISGKTVTITPGSAGDVWELLIPVAYSSLTFT